jgi:hypothetical protein
MSPEFEAAISATHEEILKDGKFALDFKHMLERLRDSRVDLPGNLKDQLDQAIAEADRLKNLCLAMSAGLSGYLTLSADVRRLGLEAQDEFFSITGEVFE